MTVMLIAGMCMPAPVAYAADDQVPATEISTETEAETETEIETESEPETEQEEMTETQEQSEISESAEDEAEPAEQEDAKETAGTETEMKAETDTEELAESYTETETESETEEAVLLDAGAVTPEPIKTISAKAGCGSVTLTWKAAENATGYKIFSYDKETKTVTPIVSTKALTYTITGLKDGTEYSYRVRPYNSDNDEKKAYFGSYSKVVSATAGMPDEVRTITTKSGFQSITLSWEAVEGATGYVIYELDGGMPGEVARTKSLTYTFKNLPNGYSHFYQISAYHVHGSVTVYSPYSKVIEAVSGRLDAITNLKIKAGDGSVTLSWNAVENANAYRIVLYDQKSHKITGVGTTRNTSYTVTGLSNGTSYSYKVRPYNNTYSFSPMYGPYSNAVTAIPGMPAAISGLKIKSGNEKVILSWKASENATGYRIFSYDPSTKKLTGIKSVRTTTYTVTGLTNGESYSYRVRPYNDNGEKLVCGAYSKIVTTIAGKPEAITDLKAFGANGEAILSWSKSEVDQYYQIFQYDFNSKKWNKIQRTTDTNAIVTGLTNGKTYRFRVLNYNRLNGTLYYAGSNTADVKPGSSKTGWVTVNGNKYYYKDGNRLKKYQKIDGKYYYFDDDSGKMLTGWHYVYGFKLYFDPKTGARWNDVDSLIGKQSSYVIKVNCQANVVNIYATDGDKGYVIPVKAFVCTTGASSTPTVKGTFYTPDKWRWQVLMGPSYGQWVTQIYRGYYFHSVFYNRYNDNNSLAIGAYNNLGNSGSHGCVRLTAGDAKWIYDNCKLGTKVITYSDSTPGPLGKPSSYHLPSWHTWDPTDPNMKYKCKQHGCH